MALIAHLPDRYLRAPRLAVDPDGGATLYAIAWEPGGERLVSVRVTGEGEPLGELQTGQLAPEMVALEGAAPGPPQPTADVTVELRAHDRGWKVRVEHERTGSRVIASPPGGDALTVWDAPGIAMAPAVAAAEGGAWVAFHHDVREDTGRPDVAKWIALRFVRDAGDVLEPEADMTDRDRDRAGVEQSFEFPALVAGEDGAVALLGRGSHNFWRQDLTAEGFSPRQPLSDGEWGSRGRRVAVVRLADGALLVARRERRGIEVTRLEPVRGGLPRLRPVRVGPSEGRGVHIEAGPEAGNGSPRGTRDPAAQHGLRTYFGDIQQHSAHSDGIGSAEEAYLRARDRYGDDFVALTDHESFLGKRTGPGEWRYLQGVADRYDEPGRFATLIAYEWTGKRYPGPGHKCVYLPRTGLPIVSRDDVPVGKDLVASVRELGGIASPHHIGWTGADEPGHDPAGQPVWEICSCHGCYEHADHPLGQRGEHTDQLVDVMLNRGHRFGFTASSDSHGLLWHHGEARKRDPYRTGLTAVQAPDLTRSAVLEAIRARRCYATSGAKILLDFTADGLPMGSEREQAGPVTARVRAAGTAPIARLEIVGPEGVVAAISGEAYDAELEAPISPPWAYARVTQTDAEMAWSSPIFLGPALENLEKPSSTPRNF